MCMAYTMAFFSACVCIRSVSVDFVSQRLTQTKRDELFALCFSHISGSSLV